MGTKRKFCLMLLVVLAAVFSFAACDGDAQEVPKLTQSDVTVSLNTITVKEFENGAYSKDDGATWQDSRVFDNLEYDTEYKVCVKLKATDSLGESPKSETVTVKVEFPATATEVISAIDALKAADQLTYADKAAVVAARTAYDALSADLQALVTNKAKLEAAETKIAELGAVVKEVKLTAPTKVAYAYNEDLDLAGAMLVETLVDGTKRDVTVTAAMLSGYVKTTPGTQTVTVTYLKKEYKFDVTVEKPSSVTAVIAKIDALKAANSLTYADKAAVDEAKTAYDALESDTFKGWVTNKAKLDEAEAKIVALGKEIKTVTFTEPTDKDYFYGEDLAVAGANFHITLVNGTANDVTATVSQITGYDKTVLGEQTLTATYDKDHSFTFKVTVTNRTVTATSAIAGSVKVTVTTDEIAGAAFVWDGAAVTAVYADGAYTLTVPEINTVAHKLKITATGYNAFEADVNVTASVGNLKYIASAADFSAALKAQADGEVWIVAAGTYDLPKDVDYTHLGAAETWYIPLYKSVKIFGQGEVILTSSVYTANGNYSTQNFITVFADGVVLDHLTLQSKEEVNKVVEVLGDNFKMTNCVVEKRENAPDFAGSIYFSNPGKTATLENVVLNFGRLSLTGTDKDTVINLKNVEINFAKSTEEVALWAYYTESEAVVNAESVKVTMSDAMGTDLEAAIEMLPEGFVATLVAGTYYVSKDFDESKIIKEEGAVVIVGTYVETTEKLFASVASAKSGDVILVQAGVYEFGETLKIEKTITVKGLGDVTFKKGASEWITVGNEKGHASIITVYGASGVVIENVTVSGAKNIIRDSFKDFGFGINVVSSDVTLNNVNATANEAAGIVVNSSDVVATDLMTSGNSWCGVNIDKQDSDKEAVLTLKGNSVLAEAYPIASNLGGVTVNAEGYLAYQYFGKPEIAWSKQDVAGLKDLCYIVRDDVTMLYATLSAAVEDAKAGETVVLAQGTYTLTETIRFGKAITIKGADGSKIETSGSNVIFDMQFAAGAVLENLVVEKTDATTQNAVVMMGTDTVVRNCQFTGKFSEDRNQTSRAIVQYAGTTGIEISGNKFSDLRQPAYLEGTGKVASNTVDGTRGFVVCANFEIAFSGNVFTNNVVDIAIIANGQTVNAYADVLAVSKANGDCFVENQLSGMSAKDGVEFVNSFANLPELIAAAEEDAVIQLGEITYKLDSSIKITKGITIKGMGAKTVLTTGDKTWVNDKPKKGEAMIVTVDAVASAVSIEDLTVTGAKTITMTNGTTDFGSGINVVDSANVTIKNVSSTDNASAGLIVNGSAVVCDNFSTSGNKWYGINIERFATGSGDAARTSDAKLTLTGGELAEDVQIVSDKSVGVTVVAEGYEAFRNDGSTVWTNRGAKENTVYVETANGNVVYATFADALAAAEAGESVVLTEGTYSISATIAKNITVKGVGEVVVKGTFTIGADVTVENVGFSGLKDDQTVLNSAIGFAEGTHTFTAKNVEISDYSYAVNSTRRDGTSVVNVSFETVAIKNCVKKGVYLENAGSVSFVECTFDGTGKIADGTEDVTKRSGSAIDLNQLIAGENVVIDGCTFTNCGDTGSTSGAIKIKVRKNDGDNAADLENVTTKGSFKSVTVKNCTFEGNSRDVVIGTSGVASTSVTVAISGNSAFKFFDFGANKADAGKDVAADAAEIA